jgi:hypothetical protein
MGPNLEFAVRRSCHHRMIDRCEESDNLWPKKDAFAAISLNLPLTLNHNSGANANAAVG